MYAREGQCRLRVGLGPQRQDQAGGVSVHTLQGRTTSQQHGELLTDSEAWPAGLGLRRGPCGYNHAWGPLPRGDPPCLGPMESPSKWRLVKELRRMRCQGGPQQKGRREGIRVPTGARPSLHVNLRTLAGWGIHPQQLEPCF